MLHLVDEALESFARSQVGTDHGALDVSFAAPDGEWAATLTKPTLSFYLWDVRPSEEHAHAGVELVEHEGMQYRRQPLPRISLSYLLTAWSADDRDEHQLLGTLLHAFLVPGDLPAEVLPEPLAVVEPAPSFTLAAPRADGRADFWSALGGQYKPGLDLVVTAAVDPGVRAPAGPPTQRIRLTVADRRAPERTSRRSQVGGRVEAASDAALVRTPRGVTVVGEDGRFLVPGEVGDEVVVESDPPRRATVTERGPVSPE